MQSGIFQFVGHTLDNATLTYVVSASGRIIKNFTPLAISGIGLFITLYGYLIISGRVQEPFSDFIYTCVKIIIISALALNAITYMDWVVSAINGLQSGLASALSYSNPSADVYQTLDNSLEKGFVVMQKFVELAQSESFTNLGKILFLYFNAGVMAFGTIVLLITGGVIVLTATLMLKIMLAIGPVFIMCLMWPVTAKFFDAWFAQVMTYVLKIVFVAVVIAFAISIFNALVSTIDPNKMMHGGEMLTITLEVMIASFLLYKIILEVSSMASGLAGGIASSAMTIGNIASFASLGRGLLIQDKQVVGSMASKGPSGVAAEKKELGFTSESNAYAPLYQRKMIENIQYKHIPGILE